MSDTQQIGAAKWFKFEQANGSVQYRLYVNGVETPFFVDVARYRAHYSYGSRIGLWGAGLGKQTSAGFRIAGFFGGFDKLSDAKEEALRLLTPPTPAVEAWDKAESRAFTGKESSQ